MKGKKNKIEWYEMILQTLWKENKGYKKNLLIDFFGF